jgi:hypothetical protein
VQVSYRSRIIVGKWGDCSGLTRVDLVAEGGDGYSVGPLSSSESFLTLLECHETSSESCRAKGVSHLDLAVKAMRARTGGSSGEGLGRVVIHLQEEAAGVELKWWCSYVIEYESEEEGARGIEVAVESPGKGEGRHAIVHRPPEHRTACTASNFEHTQKAGREQVRPAGNDGRLWSTSALLARVLQLLYRCES